MDDPYPAYADLLRAEEPLYLAQRDMWLVIRYDHVRLAAKNHAGLSSADGIAYHRLSRCRCSSGSTNRTTPGCAP